MNSKRQPWQETLRTIRQQKWPDQCEAIRSLADDASDSADLVLLNLLDHADASVREEALGAFANRSKALERIAARALLGDCNVCVRSRAADALGVVGNRLDARRLRVALRDSDWVVRASAADSLGRVGGKAAHPALLDAVTNDVHPVVRRDAAYALSLVGDASVIPELEGSLAGEEEEQARVGLLAGLYALGKRERLPELLAILKSTDDCVRYATVNSIEEVLLPADRSEVVKSMREMLETESNPGLCIDASSAIERIMADITPP